MKTEAKIETDRFLRTEKHRKRHVYQSLIDDVKMALADGKIKEGDCLASETYLCEQYKISRISVRAAVKKLIQEGVAESVHGKGTKILKQIQPGQLGEILILPSSKIQSDISMHGANYYSILFSFLTLKLQKMKIPYRLLHHSDILNLDLLWSKYAFSKNIGLILIAETDLSKLPDLRKMKCPVVQLDHCLPELSMDSVEFDSQKVGDLACKHLFSLGRKNLAYIGWINEDKYDSAKINSIISYCRKNGLNLDSSRIIKCFQDQIPAYEAMTSLLSAKIPIDGLITYSSRQAKGAMLACRNSRKRIPEDISIVSLEEDFDESASKDGLTHLKPDYSKMIDILMQRLTLQIKNPHTEAKSFFVEPSLVIGKTTA